MFVNLVVHPGCCSYKYVLVGILIQAVPPGNFCHSSFLTFFMASAFLWELANGIYIDMELLLYVATFVLLYFEFHTVKF